MPVSALSSVYKGPPNRPACWPVTTATAPGSARRRAAACAGAGAPRAASCAVSTSALAASGRPWRRRSIASARPPARSGIPHRRKTAARMRGCSRAPVDPSTAGCEGRSERPARRGWGTARRRARSPYSRKRGIALSRPRRPRPGPANPLKRSRFRGTIGPLARGTAPLTFEDAESPSAPGAFGPFRVLHQLGAGVLGPGVPSRGAGQRPPRRGQGLPPRPDAGARRRARRRPCSSWSRPG